MTCNCELCHIKSIFFTTIKSSELEKYCENRIEKNVKAGDNIIVQGTVINDFIYLKEGLVKLYRDTNQGCQIISLGKPMDFVSLVSVFSGDKYSYSVSALVDSTVCILSMKEIQTLIRKNGDFAMKLISTMNRVSESILFNYLDMSQKRLNGRVSSVLLYFSSIFDSDSFDLPISRKEMAQLIGMTTENVIRAISDFRKDGILDVYGKAIHIKDKSMLIKVKDFS